MIANNKGFSGYLVKALLLFLSVILSISALTCFFLYKSDIEYKNRIYPHVYINNADFGGKTQKDIENYFDSKNKKLALINIEIIYQDEKIATFSGKKLGLAYNGKEISEKAYFIARTKHFPSRIYQKISSLRGWTHFDFATSINFDKISVEEFINNTKDKYDRPAKNALFRFENDKVISFRQEEKGLRIEEKKFYQEVDRLMISLENKIENKTVILTSRVIEPEITLSKANKFGIEELIAEGKSDYTHSISERIHNIILASTKFNGVLVPKDKVFSFNDTIGDISSSTGYKPAYIIKDGKTVLGDGGGVCQVSTTLFRTALNAGLPIVERHAHAYRVSYYENDSKPGLDATVFSPTNDLKIKNDTPAYILIQTEVDKDNNLLYFRFYGKKDGRRIEMSPISVYDIQPAPPPLYQDDPTLKRGVVKQIDFPSGGAKASFTYKVTKNGDAHEQTFISSYRPWKAVFLVGTAD